MKLAYADVRRYDADPRTYDAPVDRLLSKDYARERATIDPDRANPDVPAGDPIASDTTYLTVVDREGNIASWIQSLYSEFGSGVTVEGMGFLLQNRGGGFTLDPGIPTFSPAASAPSTPSFRPSWSAVHIGFGIMGGPNQPLAHAQFVSNVVDYGMNVQAALEAPRFTKRTADGYDVYRIPRASRKPCNNSPSAATRSPSAASIRRRWAAARPSCTIRRPAPTTPHPTRAPTAPQSPEPPVTCGAANQAVPAFQPARNGRNAILLVH